MRNTVLRFKSWPDMLADIQRKPGMYFGSRSVEKLKCLLDGFGYAEDQYDISEADRLGGFDFSAFENWIAARYNPDRLSVGSYWLARETAGSDEGGFDLWFQWYDAFRAETSAAG